MESSREVGEEIIALNLSGIHSQYTLLRDSAKELALETRQVFGDINKSMSKVKMLHREASDGAKRCLLDYTMERTIAAETECEGLIELVSEISEDGAAGSKVRD